MRLSTVEICFYHCVQICKGYLKHAYSSPLPLGHLHTSGTLENLPNHFLIVFPADVLWAGSCEDRGHLLMDRSLLSFLWYSDDWHHGSLSGLHVLCHPFAECIYKLNEDSNRCFHITSQGIEWQRQGGGEEEKSFVKMCTSVSGIISNELTPMELGESLCTEKACPLAYCCWYKGVSWKHQGWVWHVVALLCREHGSGLRMCLWEWQTTWRSKLNIEFAKDLDQSLL